MKLSVLLLSSLLACGCITYSPQPVFRSDPHMRLWQPLNRKNEKLEDRWLENSGATDHTWFESEPDDGSFERFDRQTWLPADFPIDSSLEEWWQTTRRDHQELYTSNNLQLLTLGVCVGAVMANTGIDERLRETYRDTITLASTDDFFEKIQQFEPFGDGHKSIPVMALAAAVPYILPESSWSDVTGQWGARSIRSVVVGAPPMLALQYLTGASRPDETSTGSRWNPFHDNNGVSGHAAMGAVPFLSAAHMTENRPLRQLFYIASTLPVISRVNDDKHYASQALLGWWIAYLATTAVDRSYTLESNIQLLPTVSDMGQGVTLGLAY